MMMNIINFNISKTLQVIGGRKRKSSELLACLRANTHRQDIQRFSKKLKGSF